MTDKNKLARSMDEGKRAEALLTNPTLQSALTFLKANTLDRFESLNYNQMAEMQDCNRELKVINRFENHLMMIIQDGDSALRELSVIKDFEESMKE